MNDKVLKKQYEFVAFHLKFHSIDYKVEKLAEVQLSMNTVCAQKLLISLKSVSAGIQVCVFNAMTNRSVIYVAINTVKQSIDSFSVSLKLQT